MPESTRLPLPISRDNMGRTARAGLWILGLGFAAQFAAVGYHNATAPAPPPPGEAPARVFSTAPVGGAGAPSGGFVLPQGSQPPLVDAPGTPTEDAPPRPAPITERTFMGNAPPLVTALTDQARELRFRGDMVNALIKLREARLIEPRNGFVLAEIASTYEKMENLVQAQAYWRELRAMGDAAGVLRELADYKLGRGTTQPSGPVPGAGADFDPSAQRDASGLPEGALMGFAEIKQEQNKGPEGEPFLTVRLNVRARPSPPIEPRDVFVLVYFYETVEDQYIVQTNADVSYHWRGLPADWAEDKNTEVLEVDYRQPGALPGDEVPADKAEGLEIRKYYGYIARIYYKGELQDAAAEPVSLLSQFPPPATLPLE